MVETNLMDFQKLDLRAGRIVAAERPAWSEKPIKLEVDFGDPPAGEGRKQVLAGIANWFKPEDLIGIQAVFLINLPVKTVKNEKSEAMVLTVEDDKGNLCLIIPQKLIDNGAKIS